MYKFVHLEPNTPRTILLYLGGKWGYIQKLYKGSKTAYMTYEVLGEMFKCDSANMCAGKFPVMSMGGWANLQACTDGERGPP
jgi:CRISPR/Cas system endoribonuclease Cas6 (RAMP superfamily)